jgi:uncharacterized protein YyaL (SSP411 family)
MEWVLSHRAIAGGGFHHDTHDAAGPYLGDSLAIAQASLALYGATGERKWLAYSEQTMKFINANFQDPKGAGFITARSQTDKAYVPHPQRDENVTLARTAKLLFYYTGNAAYRNMSERTMRYLSTPGIADRLPAASVLLADEEVSRTPLHITVVGHKGDPAARELFTSALQYPETNKRLEWWDTREGKLPNPDVQYPELEKAAAFVCTDRTCSSPIFQSDEIAQKIEHLRSVNK